MNMQMTQNTMTNQTIQLQSIGRVPAVPAGTLKIGDRLMWNFGEKTTIRKIVKETEKSIVVEEKSDSGYVGNRRMLKTRLVAKLK